MKVTKEKLNSLIKETKIAMININTEFTIKEIQCIKSENKIGLEFRILQIIFNIEDKYFCSFVVEDNVIPTIYQLEDSSFYQNNLNINENFELKIEETFTQLEEKYKFSLLKINIKKKEKYNYTYIQTFAAKDKEILIEI